MLLSMLERAGNRALAVDPESRDRLAALDGRSIALNVRQIEKTFLLYPGPDGVRVAFGKQDAADVTLSASPSVFARIAAQGLDDGSYTPGELEIQGDALLAQKFAGIMGDLSIDWEELLAQQTGDIPARFISRQFSRMLGWAAETHGVMKQNLSEYLIEEARIAAAPRDVDGFLDDVDELRAGVDRLAARVTNLRQAAEERVG
jgi:ubiquinone biosynthesis protein UbiJ